MNSSPAKKAVLYVDDEQSNLTSFTAVFRKDYEVLTASSPRVAIELLEKNKHIQVIITDQRMPEMTGVQFLETVIPINPHIIRMILTGFSDVEAIIRAINSGRVFRYITKPWEPGELKQILDNAFRIYDLEEHNRNLILKLQEEVNNQKRLLTIFKKFVPENVVQEALSAQEGETTLSGEMRIVTVLISDIRDFTKLVAIHEPKIVVDLLNEYFTLMGKCIKENHGSVNKYLGDGILAIFGAPVSYINNADNAVRCARSMVHNLNSFNETCKQLIGTEITIGIAIHTGEVILGNIGCDERMEYGIVGDCVNTTARIEEITRSIKNGILISENSYTTLEARTEIEELGLYPIRGKNDELRLYQVHTPKT